MKKTILAVDDEPNNLQLLRHILRDRYRLIVASDGAAALGAVATGQPDLILLDVSMPGLSGFDVCRRLKADAKTSRIPVIFVTALGEIDDEAEGFDAGGVDYIQKPISSQIVLRRIETHLSLVGARELEEAQREAIFMLGEAGHYNDTDTGVHIWRMAAYARLVAEAVGWPEELAQRIELAAPMHDVGKIGIPDTILKAPRKLTDEEWAIMRTHSDIGHRILSKSRTPIFAMAGEIARFHHEKWDGSGYPLGLVGEAIPESARIVALVDVFDALTMKRPYKEAWPISAAMAEIRKGTGRHFEPRLIEAFERILPRISETMQEWNRREEAQQQAEPPMPPPPPPRGHFEPITGSLRRTAVA